MEKRWYRYRFDRGIIPIRIMSGANGVVVVVVTMMVSKEMKERKREKSRGWSDTVWKKVRVVVDGFKMG